MKQLFFLLFIVVLSTPFILGVSFSPGSLTYMLDPDEELCLSAYAESESATLELFDVWAEDKDQAWSVNGFEHAASDHNIEIIYPETLTDGEHDLDVCVSGSEYGEFHGALVFREEQNGSSVVQFGIWLKVIIENQTEEVHNQEPEPSVNGGSSGSSSGGSFGEAASVASTGEDTDLGEEGKQEIERPTQEGALEASDVESEKGIGAPITGNVIAGAFTKQGSIVIGIFILILLGAFIVIKKRVQ